MIRFFVLITALIILVNCGSFHNQKTISLKDGRDVTVFFDIEKIESGEDVLFVEYTSEVLVRKESTVENEVTEIWSALETLAESKRVEEAIIKYQYPSGESNGSGKKLYEALLFTADFTETGNWTIRKVD
ncbi:MAG: hypothetical protein OEM82_00940 [Acidobacteriota bacterium]|nr:hypothetical protein [Acidobacteriota bacterium]